MEREAPGRGGGALSRLALPLALVLGGCVARATLPGPGGVDNPPAVPDRVRCEGGSLPVELSGWRRAVARAVSSRWREARVEGASLTCRSVVVSQRPVVVGSNTPSVLTLQETELELSVEIRLLKVSGDCRAQRWLGRSRWRVVPLESDGPAAEVVAAEALKALEEAAADALPSSETRVDCPSM